MSSYLHCSLAQLVRFLCLVVTVKVLTLKHAGETKSWDETDKQTK
jgi:hypothetical protein